MKKTLISHYPSVFILVLPMIILFPNETWQSAMTWLFSDLPRCIVERHELGPMFVGSFSSDGTSFLVEPESFYICIAFMISCYFGITHWMSGRNAWEVSTWLRRLLYVLLFALTLVVQYGFVYIKRTEKDHQMLFLVLGIALCVYGLRRKGATA